MDTAFLQSCGLPATFLHPGEPSRPPQEVLQREHLAMFADAGERA